jgi:hypothetical protein
VTSSTAIQRNRLPLGCLALLLALFMWGLDYKLSLYHGAELSHPTVTPAKLLSEAENPHSLQAVVSFLVKSRLQISNWPAAPSSMGAAMICSEFQVPLELQKAAVPASRVWTPFSSRPPPRQ